MEEDGFYQLPLQRKFFEKYVRYSKERTVVIISDAMRYEVGKELFIRMQDDPKCTAKIEPMLSTLVILHGDPIQNWEWLHYYRINSFP